MGRTNTDVVGVILAGGQGTRMAPFSRRLPKPILPVCNRPLLDYQLESMQEAGIKECFVVVGHLGYEISLALGSGAYRGMRIHYVEQAQTLGIAHALGQLQPSVARSFSFSGTSSSAPPAWPRWSIGSAASTTGACWW
jgi:mannose-1-phosphate guanylyltransferase/phosphomannomutase